MTEKQRKGQSLEQLRKKRENKAKGRSSTYGVDSDTKRKRKNTYDSQSDDYYSEEEEEVEEKKPSKISYQDVLSIQITRDKAEQYLFKPDFENTLTGCLARISLGSSMVGGVREAIYRCVYIAGTFIKVLINQSCV